MIEQEGQPQFTAEGIETEAAAAWEVSAPEEVLQSLLETHRRLGPATGAALLRVEPDGSLALLTLSPALEAGRSAPQWVSQAAEQARAAAARGAVVSKALPASDALYGDAPDQHLVAMPVQDERGIRAVAAFLVLASGARDLAERTDRLQRAVRLLSIFDLTLALQEAQAISARSRLATQILSAASLQTRCRAASMSLCDSVGARLGCERVSVGLLKGREIRALAMSHTEKINRKMRLIQQIESVMEECFDQDLEVLWPAGADAPTITRVHAEFDREFGPAALCSVPLRRGDEPVGVITAERSSDEPFTRHEVETLRVVADLFAPRIVELRERDRWFGARMAAELRSWISTLLGPERVWIKLAAIGVLAAAAFLIFAKHTYKVEAPFALEATERNIVPAPFTGYLSSVDVEVGDRVSAGQTLARLDTADLRLRLAGARAERERAVREAAIAQRDGRIAEAQIALAGAAEAEAEIELLEHQIEQAEIRSRIEGVVVEGDLRRMLGAPVQTGNMLMEIAPTDSLRAELSVPEDQIADVGVGQTGFLATASDPSDRIPFIVEKINPIAEVSGNKNTFKVRVRLEETRPWLRPGMEGLAKVHIEPKPWGWIITRRFVNWLRMNLWI